MWLNSPWSRSLAALCSVFGVLALGVAPASAGKTHLRIFESAPFSQPSSFGNPTGIAVDQETGNVYVADSSASDVVDVFGAEGGSPAGGVPSQVTSLNGLELTAGEPESVAVDNACYDQDPRLTGAACKAFDPSNGDVYVAESGKGVVAKFRLNTLGDEYELAETLSVTGEPNGVAVDADGNVYIADYSNEGISEFSSLGSKLGEIVQKTIPHPAYTAVGAPGTVYVGNYSGGVAKLEVNGKDEVEHELELSGAGGAVAIGPNGNAYVDEESIVSEYDPAGLSSEEFGSGFFEKSQGIAVNDETEDAYVSDPKHGDIVVFGPSVVVPDVTTGAASHTVDSVATLSGAVNPEGLPLTSCEFEYGITTAYGSRAPCSQSLAELGSGATAVPVSAAVSGLEARTVYHFRLVAANANGSIGGSDQTFTTLEHPTVDGESVSKITSMDATLTAQVNPGGLNTQYRFEYGPTGFYGETLPVPAGNIGPALSDVAINVYPQDLRPGVSYHFRVVAINELGATDGPDSTFTTQHASGPLTLPDGRAWEMVSPVDKYGGVIEPLLAEGGAVQASANGDAFTYLTDESIVADPAGNTNLSQVISTREANGWSTQDIATPHEAQTGERVGQGEEYRIFSPDLSVALVEPFGPATPLSPEASERTIYLRNDSSGSYQPLVTAVNAPGAQFGGNPELPEGAVDIVSATPDLSHVVLRSEVALTAPVEFGLYEWASGQLQPISILPDEEAVSGVLGYADRDVRHAISSDGSRVVWSEDPGTENLYMRDMTRGETVQLNTPEPGVEVGSGQPIFQTASEDGSRVFFTDGQDLTSDSNAEPKAPDLYEFEVTSGDGPLAGRVKDLTAEVEKAGEHADVQGVVLGAGEDGGYVYFVATGVLSSNENGHEEKAENGADNLYAQHYDDELQKWEPPVFVVALSGEDHPDWEAEQGDLHGLSARVSSSGRYLAFMSEQKLTGYDNTDVNSGQPDEEVYLYDASSNLLVCASCNPTGARPAGVFDSGEKGLLVDPLNQPVWAGHWLAGSIPGWTATDESYALYQSRYLDDSGRLLFDSPDALVAQDINGLEDVYEYEPQGVGSCAGASETFSQSSNGCVGLISSGKSNEESVFLDASENGSDVFFLTTAKLAPQDDDEQYDVYDARECTQASPCLASSSASAQFCEGAESCEGAASPRPTVFTTPPSATFSGVGNIVQPTSKSSTGSRSLTRAQKLEKGLQACRREAKDKRSACERRVERRYGPVHKAKKKKAEKSRRGK